jgi:putative transposase
VVNGMNDVLARKSVKQEYQPPTEVMQLMETFRQMINECIRLGIKHNVTSIKSLSLLCYSQLKKYNIVTQYKLCAISKASGLLRNYRKTLKKKPDAKIPYCLKPCLVTCYGLSIKKHTLHMPQKLRIRLNPYTLKMLSDPGLKVRSITINASTLSVSFAKETDLVECTGMLGIDRNLDNSTMVDTDGNVRTYDMHRANEIKAKCKQRKQHLTRNDVRIRKMVFQKYGELERNRVHWILHNVSKRIVKHAKQNHMVIAMENIKGIRKLYRKGNGQGNKYRGRMNSWSYYELQRQIEYKALWEGIPVIYVNAKGTSAKCSVCGSKMKPEESRMLRCVSCNLSIDRDINAARNILARGLEQAVSSEWFKPVGGAGEAMVVFPLVHSVDAPQLTFHRQKGEIGHDPTS